MIKRWQTFPVSFPSSRTLIPAYSRKAESSRFPDFVQNNMYIHRHTHTTHGYTRTHIEHVPPFLFRNKRTTGCRMVLDTVCPLYSNNEVIPFAMQTLRSSNKISVQLSNGRTFPSRLRSFIETFVLSVEAR